MTDRQTVLNEPAAATPQLLLSQWRAWVAGQVARFRQDPLERELVCLSQTGLLEERYLPRVLQGTLLISASMTLAFLIWAAFTDIDEIAKTEGTIVPDGYVQLAQHLEGGIVEEILVSEGQKVQAGEVLLRLADTDTGHDLAELKIRQRTLQLHAERLRAFVEGRRPDFRSIEGISEAQASEQERIFVQTAVSRSKEASIISQQIRQEAEALKGQRRRLATLLKNAGLAREAVTIEDALYSKGLTNRLRHLQKRAEMNQLDGDLESIRILIDEHTARKAEFEERYKSLVARYRSDANQELLQVEAQISQNNEIIGKTAGRMERLEVRAPVEGLVKGMTVNTIGAVVGAGQKLMEIVPVGKRLVAEIRISPSDIGHVSVGQPVKVLVDAYDYTRYGALRGTIEFISATTFADPGSQESYYKGRVDLMQVSQKLHYPILPGMTIDAGIVTGRKTVLEYLLKPIRSATFTALTER